MIFGCKINDFQLVFPKRIGKTPQGKHKTLQNASKTAQDVPKTSRDAPQDAPKAPQDGPGAPQDAPKRRPSASQEWKKLGSKSDLQRNPLQTSIFERLGVDLGRVLMVFGSCWNRFFMDFTGDRSRAQGSPDPVVA